MKLNLFVLIAVSFLFTACNKVNRIESDVVNLNKVVAHSCIPEGVRNVDGLSADRYPNEQKPHFFCKGSLGLVSYKYLIKNNTVFVRACYDGPTLVSFHQKFDMVGFPRDAVTQEVESVMDRVEAAIGKACGITTTKNP